MISIADGSVHIQTSAEAQPATPSWLGEVALIASHLQKQGALNKICERVHFARRRFGHYDVIDFLAALFGYAISGERTLEAFYEAVLPFLFFPFHPSISLRADQLPISVELTGGAESRLEHFGELIEYVVGWVA